jgi:hypothetical protein
LQILSHWSNPSNFGDPNIKLHPEAPTTMQQQVSANQMQQISLGSVTYKSFLERSRGYVLLTFNLAGAVVYEGLASRSWAIPHERELHSETGEPFVWAFSVMPVFTIFFVVDVFWGALILVSQQWRRGYFVAADGPDLAGRCSD